MLFALKTRPKAPLPINSTLVNPYELINFETNFIEFSLSRSSDLIRFYKKFKVFCNYCYSNFYSSVEN